VSPATTARMGVNICGLWWVTESDSCKGWAINLVSQAYESAAERVTGWCPPQLSTSFR